jgi:hypothetical protein
MRLGKTDFRLRRELISPELTFLYDGGLMQNLNASVKPASQAKPEAGDLGGRAATSHRMQ